MKTVRTLLAFGWLAFGFAVAAVALVVAAEPAAVPAKPEKKITPGQAIVPDRMRRIWGELIALDPITRTGKFRNESTDEVMSFVIEPYAQLLHHAANGDVQDFIPGERAIFRLHEDEQGVWRHLTYIQDEMNFLLGHDEWFFIDRIDREQGKLTCHQAKSDESFVRTPELFIHVDSQTQYFRDGRPAAAADLKVGDKIKTKTRGHGAGTKRTAWYVFLDEASLLKFRDAQLAVHAARMRDEGLTAFADAIDGRTVELTTFIESGDFVRNLRPGMAARLAPAGIDRRPAAEPLVARVVAARMQGKLGKVTLETAATPPAGLRPTSLVRVWVPPEVFP